MQAELGITDSHLSKNVRVLADAGYVDQLKHAEQVGDRQRPVTVSLFQPDQRASASGDREGCSATALTTAAQVTGSLARRLHPHNQAPELPERQVEKGSVLTLTLQGRTAYRQHAAWLDHLTRGRGSS
ncbi:hypothetical protein [Pseudonocardia sp. HH130629-09]|uniref:hypothetical protein n=1 Tax=Pseudonocardia sp. HH130629-09 TaxID=1641402 RepID=UPI000AB2BD64